MLSESITAAIDTKTCTRCRVTQVLSVFSRDRSSADGRTDWCRACKTEAGRDLRRRRRAQAVAPSRPPEAKTCTVCHQLLPIAAFCRNRGRPDGHSNRCRTCAAAYHAYYHAKLRARTDDEICLPDVKKCGKCGLIQPRSAFQRSRNTKDGLTGWCRSCKRVVQNSWYKTTPQGQARLAAFQQRKRDMVAWVAACRAACGCACCGEAEPACLDFHHVDPRQKTLDVSRVLRRGALHGIASRACLAEEMARCVVVCANCHRKQHAGVLSPEMSRRLAAATARVAMSEPSH